MSENNSNNNAEPEVPKPATINFSPDTHKNSEEKPANMERRKK